MRVRTLVLASVLGLFACGTSGCCFIPHYSAPKNDPNRQNVAQELVGRFPAEGKDTRLDVLFRLGEPDEISLGGARFHYRWNRVVFWWMIAGYLGGSTGSIKTAYELMIDFDADGTVIHSGTRTLETRTYSRRL